MSESTKTTIPLIASREQARQLVEWAMDGIPWIYKQGRFAYFSDGRVVVRWDVEGLDVPDGSWIDLLPSGPDDCDGEPDTLTNMADWSQTAGKYECWDMKDAKRWREPDAEKIQDFEKLFTRAQTAVTPLAFDRQELAWMILMVTGSKDWPVALAPTREDGSGPWWVMGHDRRVAGLCRQDHGFNPSGDDLPEAYQEKKEEGKK